MEEKEIEKPSMDAITPTPKTTRKYEVVIVDTLNQVQNNEYMDMLDKSTMVTRDKWRDFGVRIYMLYDFLKEQKVEVINVLGYEGSGKSYGIKALNPETTLWLHTDAKPITFKGGKQAYSREKGNYSEPDTYDKIEKFIEMANKNRLHPDKQLIVFVLAHIEDYKTEDGSMRKRLKILGNMATKMNIEGSVAHTYYTEVSYMGDKPEFKLNTLNTGYNTARSPEGLFETTLIDNNFKLIVDAIRNY